MKQFGEQFACVIWGGYSWGNTGDELCLAAALERAEREFDGNVAILSHHPNYTSQLFPAANVVPYVRPQRRKLGRCEKLIKKTKRMFTPRNYRDEGGDLQIDPDSEWVRCLSRAGRLYLAGGGYLTDLFALELIMPPIQLAIQLQLPVATAPVGIGPFTSKYWAKTVVRALGHAELRVRDAVSLDFCRRRGLNATVEPDDAFALVKGMVTTSSIALSESGARKIGVCLFPQYGRKADCDFSGWLIKCLHGLKAQGPEWKIEGFCFHTSPDAEFREMQDLFESAGLPPNQVLAPNLDFRRAAVSVRNYDLIITTRFHAVVVANAFGIPNIAIASGEYYLAKMKAAVAGHEFSSSLVNPEEVAPEALLDLCKQKITKP